MEANRPSKQDADQEGAMFLLLASLLLRLAFEYAGTTHPEQTSFCNNSSGFSYLSWRQIFLDTILSWRPQDLYNQNISENTLQTTSVGRLCGWAKMSRTPLTNSSSMFPDKITALGMNESTAI